MRTDSWRLAGGMIAAVSIIMFGFSGVYRSPDRQEAKPARQKQMVRVELADQATPKRMQAKRIVPLHSMDQRTAALNRETPFVATKENPFSGQTADQTESWAEARPEAGDLLQTRPTIKEQESDAVSKTETIDDPLFPVKRNSIAQATVQQILKTERVLSPFQELPQKLRPEAALLVNFHSRGMISLGTLAEKNAEYFYAMVKKISAQWNIHFPKFQHFYGLLKDGEVYLVFDLDLDGEVTAVKVIQSYGQTSIDESCIRAIRSAGNFGPIPQEFREKGKMVVPFVFVYQRPDRPLKMFH